MKIGTDGVLLGAWAGCANETRILDVGTGSGIIALMMAQRNANIAVDAVEPEQAAAKQASENFDLSPWNDQLCVYHASLQEFSAFAPFKYSQIVCNPPFFTASLKAPNGARKMARHNDSLPVSDLMRITSALITPQGKASFIIPADAYKNWIAVAGGFSLYPACVTLVKSSADRMAHRVLVTFTHIELPQLNENELIIYASPSVYSSGYKELTRDFYLSF